ncbi:hypothetical protein [Cryptosporangium sp. NPDC051539]|uniref:hypothetical protein n=1 Tax=Cryptosporangium sp. NPDC051539 TaxID=3363962 RepID=UPI0037B6F6C4
MEQFRAALALLDEVHADEPWNPWVTEERADEYAAALIVHEQWARAEPDFQPMTTEDVELRMAEIAADVASKVAAVKAEQSARLPSHDPELVKARLALLEDTSYLEHCIRQRDELLAAGRGAPSQIEELEQKIAVLTRRVSELQNRVPDPEAVVDAAGRLPRDRRAIMLDLFRTDRIAQVRRLRDSLAHERKEMAEPTDQQDRASLRSRRHLDELTLNALLAVKPIAAAEMCADCPRPMAWHLWQVSGSLMLLGAWPCPAGPRMAAQRARVMKMLEASQIATATPKAAKEQPLAIVRSGLSIGDVIEQLTKIRADHPDAIVRRGNRNRWEIWPARAFADPTPQPR